MSAHRLRPSETVFLERAFERPVDLWLDRYTHTGQLLSDVASREQQLGRKRGGYADGLGHRGVTERIASHDQRGGDATRAALLVGGALLAADPDAPVDILIGTGGAAEGLISACAVKALGGAMLGPTWLDPAAAFSDVQDVGAPEVPGRAAR